MKSPELILSDRSTARLSQQSLHTRTPTHRQKKFDITKYMNDRSINKQTQAQVLRYLEYIYGQQEEKQFQKNGEVILRQLSASLQQEIALDFYGKILSRIEIFKSNFSGEFLQSLSLNLAEKSFGPGEVVRNQVENCRCIYYVNKGQLDVYLDQENGDRQTILGRIEVNAFPAPPCSPRTANVPTPPPLRLHSHCDQ